MQFDKSLKEMSARQVCSQTELIRSQKRKYFCLEKKFYSCQGIIRLHKKIIDPKGEIVLRILKKFRRKMQQILLGCTNRLHDMSSHDRQANTPRFRNRAMLILISMAYIFTLVETVRKNLERSLEANKGDTFFSSLATSMKDKQQFFYTVCYTISAYWQEKSRN